MIKFLLNKARFVFLFCLFPGISFAQKINNDFFLSVDTHIGTILSDPSMRDFSKVHPFGVEVNYIRPTHGEKRWQRVFHYPDMGLTFIYFDFGNPKLFGQGISLYPFINFNLTHGKRFVLKFKVATCLGYVTKKFDPVENPYNLDIGSHVNAFVNLRWNARIRLTDNLNIMAGIGLTHFSNGAMDLPNLGMNVASFDLGLAYHFNASHVQLLPDTFTLPDRNIHFVTYASAGMCALTREDPQKYPSAVFSVNLERNYGSKTKWNAGLEIQYSTSRLAETKSDTNFRDYKNIQNMQAGVKVGYAFVVDRLSLPLEMGYYVYSYPRKGSFFHRIGVRYQVSKHLIVAVTLKTQWAIADYFEFGLGYTFPLTKNRN